MQNNSIKLVFGAMCSGKSKYLIDLYKKETLEGKTVEAFKPMSKNRGGDFIVSRGTDDKLPCKRVMDITEALASKADIVIIDEYMFFNSDQLKYTLQEFKKRPYQSLVIAGLDKKDGLNYWTNYLIAEKLSDVKINLKAICDKCGKLNATISRLTKIGQNGSYSTTKGAEYEILCKACYELQTKGRENVK